MKREGKNTLESSDSNRTADSDCTKPKRWTYCLKKAFGKWHKSHHHRDGVQKLLKSKGLRCGWIWGLTAASPLRKGNTCSSLEQDFTLLSSWGFWWGPSNLWCCLYQACSWCWEQPRGYLLSLILGPHYLSLNITFMGSFLEAFWTGEGRQVSTFSVPVLSEHAHQQS